jgi:hypothetical protein
VSGHNTYFLWGLDTVAKVDPQVVIAIGSHPDDLRRLFTEVEEVAVYRCTHCMRWRDNMKIHVARGPKVPLATAWPRVKQFE